MTDTSPHSAPSRRFLAWTPATRSGVFLLAATSIAALLSEFYGASSMRNFVLWVQLPATLLLIAWALLDRARGGRQLWHAVAVGACAGFVAAVAYDIFRLPFVYAKDWHLDGFLPALMLFKVFPRFGAMILGQALEQPNYDLGAHLLGWAYHFSNGITFGVMYVALIGSAARRAWWWGVVFAVALEIGLLLTPYAQLFSIHVTSTFIAVTLIAHLIFGAVMGLAARRWWAADGP